MNLDRLIENYKSIWNLLLNLIDTLTSILKENPNSVPLSGEAPSLLRDHPQLLSQHTSQDQVELLRNARISKKILDYLFNSLQQ